MRARVETRTRGTTTLSNGCFSPTYPHICTFPYERASPYAPKTMPNGSPRTFSTSLPKPPPSGTKPIDPNGALSTTGHDEANLTGLPVTRNHRQDDRSEIERTWTALGRGGEEREFYRLIKSKSGRALPGPTADRVLNALSCLTARQGRVMQTSYSELASLAGLTRSGRSYDLIYRALDRLQDVMIETNSIWLHDREQYVREAKLYLIGAQAEVPEPGGEVEIRVAWTEEFYGMIQSWAKPIDIQSVNDLSTPIARRLYRLSELAFFHEGRFLEDLHILAHVQLGLSEHRTAPSRIKQSLKGSVKSLHENGLARVEYVSDDRLQSGNGIYVSPGPKMYDLNMEIDDPRYWAAQIAIRGVQNKRDNPVRRCRSLVERNPMPFVKKCVKGYDVRRRGEQDLTAAEGPGWLHSALKRDFKFDPYDPGDNEPHVRGGARGTPAHRTKEGALPANDYDPEPALQPDAASFCIRVHDHIYMQGDVDRAALERRADEMMDSEGGHHQWLPGGTEGQAREAVERRFLVAAYLEKHGVEALPEEVRQSAPDDLSQLGLSFSGE